MSDNFYTNIDTRGNKVFVRYVQDGIHQQEVIDFSPELYIKTNDPAKTVAKSLHGERLERVQFNDSREMRAFMESYNGIDGFSIYGSDNIMNQFVSKAYSEEVKYDPELIKGAIVDIEVFTGTINQTEDGIVVHDGPFPNPETADFPINLITLYSTTENKYILWGLEEIQGHSVGTYNHDPDHPRVGKLDVEYRGFKTEYDLLLDYVNYWQEAGFNYWSGWYIEGFDNPYMTNRIISVLGEKESKKLSPWNMIQKRSAKNGWGGESTVFEWVGCSMLDYKQLFEKHAFMNPDDYRLETVATMILGEGKVDYSDEGSLNQLCVFDYQKFVVYGMIDVDLIVQMEMRKSFFVLTFTLAYICKSNYQDTLGTVKPWTALLYSMLTNRDQRPQIKALYQGDIQFGGGFVREVKPGRYKWVVSGDLNSLYPHLIQGWNLGSETIVEPEDIPTEIRNIPHFTLDDLVNKRVDLSALKEHNVCMTANRQFFRRGVKSVINQKTREIYTDRKRVKGNMLAHEQESVELKRNPGGLTAEEVVDMLDVLLSKISNEDVHQHSLKILLNALFGAISNRYFRDYFDVRIAEGITTSGQLAILWIARKLDEYFNKVLGTGEVLHKIHHTRKPASTTLEVLSGHNFAFYQDTDSFAGDTLVDVNGKKIRVEEYYDSISEFVKHDQENKNFVKPTNGDTTISFNTSTEEVERKEIKYVMKHRVKKRMFEIKGKKGSVVVTEDHSVIICRDGEYISIKPSDIKSGDKLVRVIVNDRNKEEANNHIMEKIDEVCSRRH